MRIKFMLFSLEKGEKFKRFNFIGRRISSLFYGLKYDLSKAGIELGAEDYCTLSFFSALLYGIIFFALISVLLFAKNASLQGVFPLNLIIGFAFFLVFLLLHLFYPKIISGKIAAEIDQDLIFALKSILIQVSSGVSLFEAIKNASKGSYGLVSKELELLVQDISSGVSELKAFERMALRTKSDYLRKTTWQLMSSLKSGASLSSAVSSVVETLNNNQFRAIKNYAAELNLWILIYMLLAAALPTLGVTFLIVLSSFGGTNIGEIHIAMIIGFAFIVQIILIGFIKSRVPRVMVS
ncbi:MAG: type II secretion system F family protein [Candidatus Diapherotrites archaeon]